MPSDVLQDRRKGAHVTVNPDSALESAWPHCQKSEVKDSLSC